MGSDGQLASDKVANSLERLPSHTESERSELRWDSYSVGNLHKSCTHNCSAS